MTKTQIIISIISGLIISTTLFFGTISKINPLVSGPTETFHVSAYLMKGGWPFQVSDQISYGNIPTKPAIFIFIVNTLTWIIISFVAVYIITKFIV